MLRSQDASKDDKSTEGKSSSSGSSSGASVEWKERVMQQLLADSSFAAKVKTMERLVNQNAEEKLYHAIKYFDDEADAEKADGSGSLMPLFSFSYPPAKGRTVTALCWNPKYVDLFAVGYGSYDYAKSSASGMITCFSLKNPSFPEYVFTTSSGMQLFSDSIPATWIRGKTLSSQSCRYRVVLHLIRRDVPRLPPSASSAPRRWLLRWHGRRL
jgi:dynein intermediate chain 1